MYNILLEMGNVSYTDVMRKNEGNVLRAHAQSTIDELFLGDDNPQVEVN